MGFEEVRCPLDVRRKEVEVTPWYPVAIRDVPISATFGFHQAMYGVLQLANNCSTPMLPMLCDITIYYGYLKMSYIYWMQPLPLRHVYGSVCPLFGIWHPYKSMLITHLVLSCRSWWHLNTMGSYKIQMHDCCMHILPSLVRSILSWRFTLPFPVYVHTCVLLLAAKHSKISNWQGCIVLFSNTPRRYFAWGLWCVIVLGTTVHRVPVMLPSGACRFRST